MGRDEDDHHHHHDDVNWGRYIVHLGRIASSDDLILAFFFFFFELLLLLSVLFTSTSCRAHQTGSSFPFLSSTFSHPFCSHWRHQPVQNIHRVRCTSRYYRYHYNLYCHSDGQSSINTIDGHKERPKQASEIYFCPLDAYTSLYFSSAAIFVCKFSLKEHRRTADKSWPHPRTCPPCGGSQTARSVGQTWTWHRPRTVRLPRPPKRTCNVTLRDKNPTSGQ